MKKIAIFPGTFDPITLGHMDLIQRGTQLFDKIVIAVSESAGKFPLFSLTERLSIIKKIFVHHAHIEVLSFSGLLVDVMETENISIVLRGIRNDLDMAHEFQLASMNQVMKPDMETVFLKASVKFANISSTIVRDIARISAGKSMKNLELFVADEVISAFKHKNQ